MTCFIWSIMWCLPPPSLHCYGGGKIDHKTCTEIVFIVDLFVVHCGLLDCVTVYLHSLKGRAMRGDLLLPLKNRGNSYQSHEPTISCKRSNSSLYQDPPITKGWYQPIRSHVSNPTDGPTATRVHFLSLTQNKLGLCSANHRPGYWSNLPCDWLSKAWAYSENETENGPRLGLSCSLAASGARLCLLGHWLHGQHVKQGNPCQAGLILGNVKMDWHFL